MAQHKISVMINRAMEAFLLRKNIKAIVIAIRRNKAAIINFVLCAVPQSEYIAARFDFQLRQLRYTLHEV